MPHEIFVFPEKLLELLTQGEAMAQDRNDFSRAQKGVRFLLEADRRGEIKAIELLIETLWHNPKAKYEDEASNNQEIRKCFHKLIQKTKRDPQKEKRGEVYYRLGLFEEDKKENEYALMAYECALKNGYQPAAKKLVFLLYHNNAGNRNHQRILEYCTLAQNCDADIKQYSISQCCLKLIAKDIEQRNSKISDAQLQIGELEAQCDQHTRLINEANLQKKGSIIDRTSSKFKHGKINPKPSENYIQAAQNNIKIYRSNIETYRREIQTLQQSEMQYIAFIKMRDDITTIREDCEKHLQPATLKGARAQRIGNSYSPPKPQLCVHKE